MASQKVSTSGSSSTSSTNKPAVSAGVIPVLKDQNLFLLMRSYRYWDFPKGIVEPGETSLFAAKRELKEETGLKGANFRWGEDFIETERYSYGKVARYYLAEVESEDVIILANPVSGRKEHDEYRWLTYDQALKLLVPRVKTVLEWAQAKIHPREPGLYL
ncbi:MAG: NUDIX domain-containing protein [Proteobacteria bacterium]|nr:MAG: NUDIX domain-containing protein [Pseudomonadota bacterium]RYZ73196.1 MAG: NUDIX domain-containing protein [Pseudomonadota bacterium]